VAVTLKDIAERVGKSVPTVSRALAGFEDISPKTRQEVQRVAQEMGYEPNITARNLQKQRTDSVALILPTARYLRFSDRETYTRHIRGRRVDGFIVVRTRRQDGRIEILQEHDVPFVAFGRVEGENAFHLVDYDDADGIRQVVDHLVQLGHTRLGFITEPTVFTKPYHRLQGFLEGLHAHGLPNDPDLIVEANFRQRSGHLSASQLLNLSDPPTAIVACNDLIALGAISAAQERGLVVGRDVCVTGYDDIMVAEYANPPLTTVHQPAQRLGMMVAQMLLKIIAGEPIEERQIILKPSLVVRQSSGPRGQLDGQSTRSS
jgi:LacI family transcriptional regulator